MKATTLYALMLAIFCIVPDRCLVYAQTEQSTDYESFKADIERIREEQNTVLEDWIKLGQEYLESFKSPFISADDVAGLPSECLDHLKEDQKKLEQGEFTRESWLGHVFECDKCCGPLLAHLMDMHVSQAVGQPHVVVLFDFDTFNIKQNYKEKLDNMINNYFEKGIDKILLIGRASQIGERYYNIILSGKRAGEVKDYFIANFGIDESRIRFLYFGYDPPQLTPQYASAYGVTEEELSYIDSVFSTSNMSKMNQSVVVVVYKGSDRDTQSDRVEVRSDD